MPENGMGVMRPIPGCETGDANENYE